MVALAKAVRQDAGSLLKKGHKKMERLTIPDEKIDGGMKRTCVDSREVKKYAMTLYWALKKYEDIGLTPDDVKMLKGLHEPKKPTYEGDGYAPDGTFVYDTWECPNCGEYYEVDYDDYDYCPKCGQKIDWSEVKNEREES